MGRPKDLQGSLPILRRFLLRFAPSLAAQRNLLAGSFAALFAQVLFRVLEPWPLGLVIDHVLGAAATGESASQHLAQYVTPETLLWLAPVLLVVFTGLRALCAYLSTVGFALAGNRVLTEVRNVLYQHLQALSLAFHTKARSGDLVIRVIGDVGLIREVVVTALLPLLGNILILLAMLSVMFWLNRDLTLVALCVAPLFWLSTARLGGRIHQVSRKLRRREGDLATTAAESIGAIHTVQALALDESFSQHFARHNTGSLKEGVQAKRLAARLERTVDVLSATATAAVLLLGARTVLRGELMPGELVIFLTYLRSAFRPLRNFAKYSARLAKASAAAERVLEILDREPDVRERPGARPAARFRGSVRYEHASFAYGDGAPVLRDVDFEVGPGAHVALVGPSGSGKSTLVSALLRLLDPISGRVCIDGEDVRDFTLASLRRQVTVVLQDSLLFAGSVRDNIAFGAPDATPEQIVAAARLANAHEFIERLTDGYDSAVGERGLDLSAGQRQRIAIARAAISRAPIVTLDEPLRGLDSASEQSVAEALDRLVEGRTSFTVTHDPHRAARCDLILYVDGGGIRERGSHEQLMRAGGEYARRFLAHTDAQRELRDETDHALAG